MILFSGKVFCFIEIITFIDQIQAFTIKQTSISPTTPAQVGKTVTLNCQSDSYFEYCDWWHGEWENDKVCKFEWKYSHDAVKRQRCTKLHKRMRFVGDYESHECKVELSNVQLSDSGVWTCRVEEYKTVISGRSIRKTLNLEIVNNTKPVPKIVPRLSSITEIGIRSETSKSTTRASTGLSVSFDTTLNVVVSPDYIGIPTQRGSTTEEVLTTNLLPLTTKLLTNIKPQATSKTSVDVETIINTGVEQADNVGISIETNLGTATGTITPTTESMASLGSAMKPLLLISFVVSHLAFHFE